MGELRLSGLSTGIDTSTLIKQLIAVERRQQQLYMTRQDVWKERKAALSELQTKLKSLKDAAAALSNSGELRAYSTASSDTDIVTAEASHNAFEGNHAVVVNQLANAERWVHTGGLKHAESLVGAGTFIYSYNSTETVLTTTADTTLEDLVGLINNDAKNPGVTANLLFYNDAYHLMLNGNDAGSDYEILINPSNTEVWQTSSPLTVGSENAALADKITGLDQFAGVLTGDESITITGTTHDGAAVSHNFAINENTTLGHLIEEIDDAFAGTAKATLVNGQIRLTSTTSGASQMQLTLAYDAGSGSTTLEIPSISRSTQGGSTVATLAGFAVADFTETQSAQDSRIKVDGYPLGEDEWITRSSNTIDNVIHGVTLHLHDTGTVQVNLTRDVASVREKLNTLVSKYNELAAFLKDKTAYNQDTKVAGVLMSDFAVSSIFDNVRQPLIRQTSGFVIDMDSFLMPGQIGLELDRDGLLNLSNSDFEKAIAKNYMGALALIGADKTGSSDSNTIEFYSASSANTTATTYNVEVTVSGGAITGARIRQAGETTWRDAGFSENIVTGNSTFNENNLPVHPENGLQLSVDLNQDGTFTASVRVKQGFTGAMEDALDRILKAADGILAADQAQVDAQIKHLQERIDTEEQRLTQREEILVAKYARLEKTLTLVQNQMAALGLG
jgi:flagellar hook-associated protein 2